MFYNADSFITHPINTKKAVLKIKYLMDMLRLRGLEQEQLSKNQFSKYFVAAKVSK